MRPKKSLGQNFLMHARIAERIADAARIGEGDTVLEIGPGTGMLTRPLLNRASKVIAVEADAELLPGLLDSFKEEVASGRLTLIHADIREFSPDTIEGPYRLVANIPYYITGEIFRQFLSARAKPESMTLLVQKEVAERVARAKKESLLSLSIKAYGLPKYEFTVPRGAFRPAPSVDSAVLSVRDIRNDVFPSRDAEEAFFETLRAGFAHKRKLLSGNLSALVSPDKAREALIEAGIPPKARAEDVKLPAWRALSELLSK